MSIQLTMPRLSDTMETGTIIKWNVGVGDEVTAGDVVADIETDKATMEMQVFDDGVIAGLLVDPGNQVPVGTLIAVLAEEGESVADVSLKTDSTPSAPAAAPAAPSAPVAAEAIPATPTTSAAPASMPPASGSGERIKVSPVARRIASERGIDLVLLKGTGPGGRIIKRDVLGYAAEPVAAATTPSSITAPAPLTSGEEPLSGMRQTIARRLVESKTTIPHYQVSMSFDMESLVDIRSQVNERLAPQGRKVSVNDFIVKACALAIHEHRYFNASFGGDRVQFHAGINVGVAIALPEERGGGLVVATIRDADRMPVGDIAVTARELAEKARTRGLSPEDMADSTFTISNLGMFGVDHFTAIINPPNSAILACGAAIEQPVLRDGVVVPGVRMTATLSLDHRVIDGAMAARYLQTLKQLIEKPAMLLV
jgi:pyruvate dehydrogenase E2 component (dihydrolipoamide acetyltransferase)